jgi:hypothetical protein
MRIQKHYESNISRERISYIRGPSELKAENSQSLTASLAWQNAFQNKAWVFC